jgi:hypothetical protein
VIGNAQEAALAFARLWRERGNKILIVALIAEFLLEIWSDNRHAWSLWTPNEDIESAKWRIKRKLIWLRRRLPSKHRLMILSVGVVALGVSLEWWYGDSADTISDQIRTGLQSRIISLSPYSWLLGPDVIATPWPELKTFAGQRAAICAARPESWNDKERWQVAGNLAQLLDAAGWRNAMGKRFLVFDPKTPTQWTYDGVDLNAQPFSTGIEIAVDTASKSTNDAAQALTSVLLKVGIQGAGSGWAISMTPECAAIPPPTSGARKNLMAIYIGPKSQ